MTSTLPAVDQQRVIQAMARHGITLDAAENSPAATANLNGLSVTFAAIGSVVIVRADRLTDVPSSAGDAAVYLAANHLNSIQMEASATILDYADTLIARSEHEVFAAAGMSDAQLDAALKVAVDGVLTVQDSLQVVAEQFGASRS